MSGSLYEILEIPRKATKSQIEKAFRKRSKEHHPDRGGDREDFEKIAEAYRVLSDPELRKRYDKDGTIDKRIAENAEAEVLSVLLDAFNKAVMFCMANNQDVGETDLIEMMRNALRQGEQVMSKEIQGQLGAQKTFEKTLKRWKGVKGENHFEAAARQMIENFDNNIKSQEHELDKIRKALEKIKGVTYDHLKRDATVARKSPYAYGRPDLSGIFGGSLGGGWTEP